MNRFDDLFDRVRRAKGGRRRAVDPSAFEGEIERHARNLRAEDPDTERQWARMAGALDAAGGTAALAPPRRKTRRLALAGGLALATATVAAVVLLRGVERSPLVYQTGRGEIRQILLADSSEVTLNHSSMLAVRRNLLGSERSVELSGEAYFAVRSNGAPFVVRTGIGTVHVTGTAFNVREREGVLEVAVARGSVDVTSLRAPRDSVVHLAEGYLTIVHSNDFPGEAQPVSFARIPGWLYGEFQFDRTPLRSVLWEIENRFDISVEIAQPAVLETTITGTLHGRDPYAVLSAVCAIAGLNLQNEDQRYTLY